MENKVYMLEDMRELARRAHSGTSFSPEKRGDLIIAESSEELEEDLKKIPEADRERYILGYRKHLSAYLSAHSRVYSTMITGPANFPVARMEKANRVAHNRLTEFIEWRKKALHAIEKNRLAHRTPEQFEEDVWKQMYPNMLSSIEAIIDVDLGIAHYTRPLLIRSVVGTITTWSKNGWVNLVKRGLDQLEYWNKMAVEKGAKVIVTANHSVWKLGEAAVIAQEQEADKAVQENESEMITDIEIVKNYKIDRLQIIFPTKPNEEWRNKLKGRAFRWSPTEGAWQRQLTGNAEFAAKQVLKEMGVLHE